MVYEKLDDLKYIKKHYGEKMAHLCREFFPTILEYPGTLYDILTSNFDKSKSLYYDLVKEHKEYIFKEYIYCIFDYKNEQKKHDSSKSVKELLSNAGYDLYECKTYEDILKFKKYYRDDEELCTFKDQYRIDHHHIFFIVKKNVNDIKRENFEDPKREDEYGTSVLDLQFDKGLKQRVSIKCRYNHTVTNPDSTYSNNLEEIAPGLTDAFERDYGFNIGIENKISFELKNYIKARDGKFYKYNYELFNVHYCPDNLIIDDGKIIDKYKDKGRYTLMDYFILDHKTKRLFLYDKDINDSFIDEIEDITDINIISKDGYREVNIKYDNGEKKVTIKLDKYNRIIGYENNYIKSLGTLFLNYNTVLKEINMPNLESIGDYFLYRNKNLEEIDLPKLTICGKQFLANNSNINKINLPLLEICGSEFLIRNSKLEELDLPNLRITGENFISKNSIISKINLPKLETCENLFLCSNKNLTELDLPNLTTIKRGAFSSNEIISKVNLPKLEDCDIFLPQNKALHSIELPNLVSCTDNFLSANNNIELVYLPKLRRCKDGFLSNNMKLKVLLLPELESCGDYFLFNNNSIEFICLDKLVSCGDKFLVFNDKLEKLYLPNLETCGNQFMYYNTSLKEIYLPKLKDYDDSMFRLQQRRHSLKDIINNFGQGNISRSH